MNIKKRDKTKEEILEEADVEIEEIDSEKEELIVEADEEISEIDSGKQSGDEELKNLENQLKRALADYQNLEKRVMTEKSGWIMSANKNLILRLLPGIDSLLLADKHSEDTGVKISIKHFIDILESEGVEKIDTIGKDFDPNLMEAISTKEGEDGKVVEELKAGYTLNGDVIRAAQVMVGASSSKQN